MNQEDSKTRARKDDSNARARKSRRRKRQLANPLQSAEKHTRHRITIHEIAEALGFKDHT